MADERYDDPRIYFAAERTFLAWIRTGLALMGFGFVVARFGLFLRQVAATQGANGMPPSNGFSPWVGVLMISGGIVLMGASTLRHLAIIRELRRGGASFRRPSMLGIALATLLAVAGVAMAIHLLLIK